MKKKEEKKIIKQNKNPYQLGYEFNDLLTRIRANKTNRGGVTKSLQLKK